jgi:hypothetical protein
MSRNLELVIHKLSERGAILLSGGKEYFFIPKGLYTEQKLTEYFKTAHKDLILTPKSLTIPFKYKLSLSKNLITLLHLDPKIINEWAFGTLIRDTYDDTPTSDIVPTDTSTSDIMPTDPTDIATSDIPTADISTADIPTTKSQIFYLTCDQIDIDANFFNGIPSNIIAEISGYTYKPQHILYFPLNNYCRSHELLSFHLLNAQMRKITPTKIYFTVINKE